MKRRFYLFFVLFLVAWSEEGKVETHQVIKTDAPIDVSVETTNETPKESVETETEEVSKKEYYRQKLDEIETGLSDLEHYYAGGFTNQMLEAEYETLKRWDDALNEIYQALQAELSPGEMETLRKEQRTWIAKRDQKAEEAKAPYGNGSGGDLAYVGTLHMATKERCYELLDYFPS